MTPGNCWHRDPAEPSQPVLVWPSGENHGQSIDSEKEHVT